MLVCFVALSIPANFSLAATLYLDPGIATIYRGDAITTSIRIMPNQAEGECINAADVVITYSDNIQPVDISIGRSIFSVWVEDPIINKENKTITLAGGIPNGYCGRVQGDPSLTNIIAEIVFRSPGLQIGVPEAGNTAVIDFAPETQVYINDGQGTKANLTTLPSTITLERTVGSAIADDWREAVRADNIPPEDFSISLEKDILAFNGRYFIVFTTTDKQTGLSHYEVMEEPFSDLGSFTWGGTDVPWVRTVSPYVLKDQSLNSTIRVRAFDKAGNEYVATLIPDESMRTISATDRITYVAVGVAVVVVILIILLVVYIYRRRKKVQSSPEENFADTIVTEQHDE